MDPQQRILLEVAYQAMESSGYLRKHRRDDGDNVGCFIGASFNEYLDNTSAHIPTAYTSTGTIRAFLCGKISYYFGWSGPAEVIDTACSASLVAINRACRAIMTGECPMALAGGVNIMSGINNYMDLGKAGFLSPTGQCKPFDQKADGYCRADGAGLVVLKSLRHARADGDHILGVIPAVATNQGGLSASITVPHSPAQMALYRRILKQAGMKAEHVSYVECHGTGTQAGDPLEIASVREVFSGGDRQGNLHIGSLKGNIGHCETAAGVASLLKVLSMLQNKRIPPLASFKTLNPKIPALAPDKIAFAKNVEQWDAPVRAACVNSYGAAGSNSALLCVEAPSSNLESAFTKASTWPIIVSAASKESLTRYCRTLERHLTKHADLTLSSVAFTLAEKRQRHRFQLTGTASDVESLRRMLSGWSVNDGGSGLVDAGMAGKKKQKAVVLAFGGQSKPTIGLDRTLYDSSPRLRAYLDECNGILQDLGYPSILPGIFSQDALDDVVLLQTGTFAVQYATAKCWTDAGVHVSAVVGHSFGELTALAFSGVLTLRSGLVLVAARAKLMATRWGSEKGSMLAVHAERPVIDEVIRKVRERDSEQGLEIACYNAINSHVVVGSAAAIDRAQQVLAKDFSSVRSQQVNVTHGFHSRFTEPLLEELSAVAQTLSFREPKIPLEMCVPSPSPSPSTGEIQRPGPARIAEHARDPVYFVDAVRRIEARLGPDCVWLEAGTDAPIIPMVKRAVAQPADHIFLALRFAGAKDPAAVLAETTTALWREQIHVTFWPSLGTPAESGLSHGWLPPYEFDRTSAWVENIDHTVLYQKKAEEAASQPQQHASAVATRPEPPMLVTPISQQDEAGATVFKVNVASSRFREIVSGHAVRSRPLCPASMYMECATMALQLHLGTRFEKALSFDDLSFEQPLGVDDTRHVTLLLRDGSEPGVWAFELRSTPQPTSANTKPRVSIHGRGKLRLGNAMQLHNFQHLIAERVDEVSKKPGTETLMLKRAYGLFSQVVTYAPLLQGMHSLIMDGTRAVASIRVPSPHVAPDESTAISICDTVSIDTFIQVVGLLINSSDACIPNHVFVATGVQSTTMSEACNFNDTKSWTVYAVFRSTSETSATGDVFVLTPAGEVAMNVMNVKFTRLPISTLEKMLDTANSSNIAKKNGSPTASGAPKTAYAPAPVQVAPSPQHVPELDEDYTDSSTDGGLETPPGDYDGSALRKMISMYTGAPAETFGSDSTMADLGIDSLAAVEFAEDLRSQYGKEIESTDLLTSDLIALSQLFLTVPRAKTKKASKVSKKASPASVPVSSAQYVSTGQVNPLPNNGERLRLLKIVSDACGAPISDIKDDHTLRDLGVDSLAAVELKSDLEDAFSTQIDENDVHLDCTIAQVLSYLNIHEDALAVKTPVAVVEPFSATTATQSMPSAASSVADSAIRQRVFQIISDACGAPTSAMKDGDVLRDLGVDSLAAVELKSELEDAFGVELDDSLLDLSIAQTVKSCGGSSFHTATVSTTPIAASTCLSAAPITVPYNGMPKSPAELASPFDALVEAEKTYMTRAIKCKFESFAEMVAPRQNELMLAYIIEGLADLGADLRAMRTGETVPAVTYRRKHAYDRLMERVWIMLEMHGLMKTTTLGERRRGSAECPHKRSAHLLQELQKDFPAYNCEFALIDLTGSKLSQCLAGKQDPVGLMFKTQASQAIMENFYLNSPMLATSTDLLVDTVVGAISGSKANETVRILEVGAGCKYRLIYLVTSQSTNVLQLAVPLENLSRPSQH